MKTLTTVDLLDRLKARFGLTSDYQLFKHMRWHQTTVSKYRVGRSRLSRAHAMQIADALELPREYVFACVELEREPSQEVRGVLESIAERFRGAAVILAALLLGGTLAPSTAYAGGAVHPSIHYAHYEARRARRRLDRFLARFLGTWFPAQLLQPLAVRP